MSISTVVTRGYGSFGSTAEVVTRGYSIAAVAVRQGGATAWRSRWNVEGQEPQYLKWQSSQPDDELEPAPSLADEPEAAALPAALPAPKLTPEQREHLMHRLLHQPEVDIEAERLALQHIAEALAEDDDEECLCLLLLT